LRVRSAAMSWGNTSSIGSRNGKIPIGSVMRNAHLDR
jgi:hypothetical protein